MNVADLSVDEPDALGARVMFIYARKAPEFAVYRTVQRLLVHFADDPVISDDQRKRMSGLAPLRGEIAGLIDGWRSAPDSKKKFFFRIHNGGKLRSKAERYDRRVADALHVGLEGDLTGAELLLARVKEDILNERVGWSRFEYLITAFLTVIGICLVSTIAMLIDASGPCRSTVRVFCVEHAIDLWHGFAGGATGAFFSIALAIRGRTILTDLYRTSNLMDAVLRVVVGAIGGVVLVALILAGFVRFHLGDSSPDEYQRIHILIVAFVAGFAERLVPDLLAKADARTGERPIVRQPEPIVPPAETLPGGAPQDRMADASTVSDEEDLVPEQSQEDDCVVDAPIEDDEVTNDEDLPRASGGIAAEADRE